MLEMSMTSNPFDLPKASFSSSAKCGETRMAKLKDAVTIKHVDKHLLYVGKGHKSTVMCQIHIF